MINVRNRRVTKKIDIAREVGLELGPLMSPIVTKDQGEIYYLDHMSQADLKKKYQNEPVDPNKIVDIDYVLNDSLKATVKSKVFDYVIASHVIEHIPDTVGWLNEVSEILKPGGILSLVVPDKRFTFDIDRAITTPSEVMGAYVDGIKMPTSAMMYEYASLYAEGIDTASVWNDEDYYKKLPPKRRWSREQARDMCHRNNMGEYIDCHCYVYTPASFIEILRELTKNELIDFEVCSFLKTQKYELEFYISLRKIDSSVSVRNRLRKLPKIVERTKKDDQIDEFEERLRVANEHSYKLALELEAIRGSASWRLTSWLRRLAKSIRSK